MNDKSGNANALWDVMRRLTKKSQSKNIILNVNDVEISDLKEVVEYFNTYFVDSVSELTKGFELETETNKRCESLEENLEKQTNGDLHYFSNISIDFVIKQIKSYTCKKATGYDELSVKILKYICDIPHVMESLVYILNLSLHSSVYPDAWKIARVQPIPKGGDTAIMKNYRPVSILPVLSKIIERAVYLNIFEYLSQHNLFYKNQFGFRPKHSCETALLCMVNQWSVNVDKGYLNGVAFIDLRRAFDTVNHSLLLNRLHQYGCSPHVIKWFESHLKNRQQFVSLGKEKSTFRNITMGVPQGSILAPLLFTLFVNDLPCSISNGIVYMYADDTTISVCGKTKQEVELKLTKALGELNSWLNKNKLILNSDKTKTMLLGSKQKLRSLDNSMLSIELNRCQLECVYTYKCLGVIIDNSLDFKKHIESIALTVKQKLGTIRRCKHYFDKAQLNKLYWDFVVPHLMYCCTVWSGRSEANHSKLERLHKRAAYMISRFSWETPSEQVFETLSWPKVDHLFFRASCCMIHKCLHKAAPEVLGDKFIYIEAISSRTTSSTNKMLIRMPHVRTTFYQKSFLVTGPSNWNKLPERIRFIKNMKPFKQELAKWQKTSTF